MSISSPETVALDPILERDPAGVYAAMDAGTRERYRQACQELAVWSGRDPVQVANEALRLCEEHDTNDPRGRHVGEHLLAGGRPRLEARLGCRVPWVDRVTRFVRRHAVGLYVGSLVLLTGLVLLGMERFLAARELELSHRLILTALFALSVLEFLQELVDFVLWRLVPDPPLLPKLDPERVLSRDTRTLVVTPLLVASAEDIEAQLRKLEINYLGNVAPDLLFALLTDFPDAPAKELPGESELLERLERGIHELNARHGYGERPHFFWLHRERRWNPVAGRWMGWERKRGKLEEFNRLVLGASDTSYTGAVPEVVRTIRYAITLDADTHLIPGSAARLVATLHHPLNQARFDATGRRVVAGYSMIQPSLEDGPTKALWLSSGGWPMSIARPRGQARPSLTQSLFGTGEFLGKGIYDVAAFTRALDGRIPENAVLSHDKLEGMFARVAFAQDIKLLEARSPDLAGTSRIWHRWIRGDWQLLPWILPRVPAHGGRGTPNPLTLLDRWKLLADLRRSLSFPSALLAVSYGWLWSPGGSSARAWTLGATLWLSRHAIVIGTEYTLRNALRYPSFMEGLRFAFVTGRRIFLGSLMTLAALLPFTGIVMDAIVRALYRLGFDRTRILDWTTHSQANRKVGALSSLVLPEVWGAAVLALGIAGALAASNPGALPWASPMLVAWIPLVVLARRDRPAPTASGVAPAELDRLRDVARRCWARYEEEERAAEFTPTDVALGLVAPLSAYHLGYLDLEGLVSRLEKALSGLAGLERYRGHLLDRYDVRDRRPLGPRRIATAESGMLAAALVSVERCLRVARTSLSTADAGALRARLGDAETRGRALREEMDFAFLYDSAVDLFHVGYDVESRSLDGAHHEQLASGGLLAGFVAIAERQVPLRHWVALIMSEQRLRAAGRAETVRNTVAEHLLPTLFLWFPPATLLGEAALAALDAAFEPGAAPPLSVLTLRFRPGSASESLQRLVAPEALGSRREQGVTLAAVANLACDDILLQHFHQHWRTGWVEALVYETKDAP
jgi:hypothetical protein